MCRRIRRTSLTVAKSAEKRSLWNPTSTNTKTRPAREGQNNKRVVCFVNDLMINIYCLKCCSLQNISDICTKILFHWKKYISIGFHRLKTSIQGGQRKLNWNNESAGEISEIRLSFWPICSFTTRKCSTFLLSIFSTWDHAPETPQSKYFHELLPEKEVKARWNSLPRMTCYSLGLTP